MKSNLLIIFAAAYLLTGCAGPIPQSHYNEPQDKQPTSSSGDRNSLIKMAEEKFGKLNEADKKLFAAVADGNLADYREGGNKDKPEDANSWGERRTINANRIEWLCRDKQAKELVTDKGIQVAEAKIAGVIDLSYVEVPFPLIFGGCVFKETINIQYSKIKFLYLSGSQTRSILADEVKVEDSVFLRNGFKANGAVSFFGADIGGDFDCSNGEYINKDGSAISADGISVKGSVFLSDGFKANGEVRFPGAVIGGDFVCVNGEFINEGGKAIIADGVYVKGGVFLIKDFKANGEVRFPGAMIGGNFDCHNGKFINEDSNAIVADGMDVKGSVVLRDANAEGEARFPGTSIGGNFECDRGEFNNINGNALVADRIDVKGNVFLRNGFRANGRISFMGAVIGRDFMCNNGKFINERGAAIAADRIDVKGAIWLSNDFKSNGEVRFLGATIGENFVCEKGEFINEGGGKAIVAEGIDVKGSVFLRNGFKADGLVSLVGATIGGHFIWRNVNLTEKTRLDLSNVKAGVLFDDSNSWPKKNNLFLDGFVYEYIEDGAPKDVKSRIEWLNRQGDERFRPGPYEQLAMVLEKMGHNEDAKKIRIEKEEQLTKRGGFGLPARIWRGVLKYSIGYGYQLWRAVCGAGGFIVLGWILFFIEHHKNPTINSKPNEVPKFNSFVYSIETFIPLVNLNQAEYWWPKRSIFRIYYWIHRGMGWILTTLLIVGLTGLIK